jgi:uncharacterized membrane protein (UPF0127 family)
MSRFIFVQNRNQPHRFPARVKYCDSFWCRLRGLMFRNRLEPDDGLLLVQGPRDSRIEASIHMLFVPFDLSVFWINADLSVVDKVIAKAWRPAYFPMAPARYILELHPQRWEEYQIGDQVEFQNA